LSLRDLIRQKLQKNVRSVSLISNVGKGESQYFDNLEQEYKWKGIRQYFIEELGYFVDYYEPTLNIVVEYDEPRHYKNGRLKSKDMKRMEEIQKYLGNKFTYRVLGFSIFLKKWRKAKE
jgi:very-short-patch-repair endonuclease